MWNFINAQHLHLHQGGLLTGPPGTCKSTRISDLVATHNTHFPHDDIYIVAPTVSSRNGMLCRLRGAAADARVLPVGEALGRTGALADADVIIVDEAFLLTLAQVRRVCRYTAPVLFVGDPYQVRRSDVFLPDIPCVRESAGFVWARLSFADCRRFDAVLLRCLEHLCAHGRLPPWAATKQEQPHVRTLRCSQAFMYQGRTMHQAFNICGLEKATTTLEQLFTCLSRARKWSHVYFKYTSRVFPLQGGGPVLPPCVTT